MPVVSFESLPDASRVWVFGSDQPLGEDAEKRLLKGVDEYLGEWKAHGEALTVAREWRDNRFLAVAVDQSSAGASGCSIDGLFRVLQRIQADAGVNMIGGGRVFYRDDHAAVRCVPRSEVPDLVNSGAITRDTVIFDTTLTDLGAFRACFETRAKDSWVKEALGE